MILEKMQIIQSIKQVNIFFNSFHFHQFNLTVIIKYDYKVPTLNLNKARDTYKVNSILEEPLIDHESPIKRTNQTFTSMQSPSAGYR